MCVQRCSEYSPKLVLFCACLQWKLQKFVCVLGNKQKGCRGKWSCALNYTTIFILFKDIHLGIRNQLVPSETCHSRQQ